MRVAMVAAAAAAVAACRGPEVREPAPEFDDLDPETELRGPKVLGPPRIIDAERLADVLEGLPHDSRYTMLIDGTKVATVRSITRRSAESEPGGFISAMSIELQHADRSFRAAATSYYAKEPPHRLLGGFEVENLDSETRRWDYRNDSAAMWIRSTNGGTVERPLRRPASRETLEGGAAIFVDPNLLEIGAMQTFSSFDVTKARDFPERMTVIEKGIATVNGRQLPTVVFETDIDGRVARTTVAGGRLVLSVKSHNITVIEEH